MSINLWQGCEHMKKICIACGRTFEATRNAKCCQECRNDGKRICAHCGHEIIGEYKHSYCKECNNILQEANRKKREAAKKRTKTKTEQMRTQGKQTLDEKITAAQAAGISYGKYSAMRRGLLRI